MKNIATLLLVLVVLAGAMVFYHFSDAQVKKRAVLTRLGQWQEAVSTKDREKVTAALSDILSEDARVHLKVEFFSLLGSRPAMEQNFDRLQFIAFVDNILYSLSDYSTAPSLQNVDGKTDSFNFTSAEWGDGNNMLGGQAVAMRYGSNTECTGKALFEDNAAKFTEVNCTLQFHQVPKPGQERKILNENGVMDRLGIQQPQQP